MPVRSFFNDPGIAAAAGNLSSLFAPPSGADAAGWAAAKAERDKAQRLSDFYAMTTAPGADWSTIDKAGVGAGVFAPTQTMERVDRDNRTTMRGQDVSASTQRYGYDTQAATARQNNVLDNQRGAITSLFGALNPDQVRPAVPEDLMQVLGLPGLGVEQGIPGRPSRTEVEGAIIQNLPLELQQAIGFGATPVESVVTPEGPRIATRMDAIGQEPFVNQGAEAKPTNGLAVVNGQQVAVVQRPGETFWREAQTGTQIPAGVPVYDMPKATGTADEIGLTTSVKSGVQGQIISIDQTKQTAVQLKNLIASAPSAQGLVGALRGTAQDMMQTGGELGQFFGGQVAAANDALREGLMDADLAGAFDPNIPAIEMMTNLLAWQYAKSMSGDRVSNEQLRAARTAIGGSGLFANQANSLARLDQLIKSLDDQRANLGALDGSIGAPAGTPASGGTRMKFDANGNPVP